MRLNNINERKKVEAFIEEHFKNSPDEEKIKKYEESLKIFSKKEHNYLTVHLIKYLNNSDLKFKYAKLITTESYCVYLLSLLKNDEEKINIFNYFTPKVNLIYLFNSLFNKSLIKNFLPNSSIYDPNYQGKNGSINFEENFIVPSLTFGIEIEAINGNANVIRNLNKPLLGTWLIHDDDSLVSNSVEIVSPPLNYTKDNINKIYWVCEFLKNNGLETTNICANHIHIGSNILDTKESWICFYYLYSSIEQIVAILSNEKSQLIRKKASYYSKSIYENFIEAMNKGIFNDNENIPLNDFISLLKELMQPDNDRHYSVNILNISENKNKETLEFRIPNGTLNPLSIHQNIKLFARIILLSKALSNDLDKGLNYIDKLLHLPIEKRAIRIINVLFKSDFDKKYFIDRWINNFLEKENEEITKKLI